MKKIPETFFFFQNFNRNKSEILLVLKALSNYNNNNNITSNTITQSLVNSLFKNPNTNTNTYSYDHNITNSNTHSFHKTNSSFPSKSYSSKKLLQQEYLDKISINPLHPLHIPYNSSFKPPGLNGKSIDELILIRDILYSCQGIENDLIENRNPLQLEASQNIMLLPSQRNEIRQICKIGVLHYKLREFINQYKNNLSLSKNNNGLVLQTFLGTLEEELTNLYQLFSILHESINESLLIDNHDNKDRYVL